VSLKKYAEKGIVGLNWGLRYAEYTFKNLPKIVAQEPNTRAIL
jgi:hypothetical protein